MQLGSVKSAYAIDERRFPLVCVRATEHVGDPEALKPTYAQLEQLLARGQPFVVCIDLRGAASSPKRRQRLMEWGARHDKAIRQLWKACAVIVGSQLERGFVTAALWLAPPPMQQRVFTKDSEAEAWLLAVCQELHLS